MTLETEFRQLSHLVEQLLSLLDEGGEQFWGVYLQRGLDKVKRRELGGATDILGCFGGADTLADLTIGQHLRETDPQRYHNLNARLGELRTQIFKSASTIASRQLW